MGILDRIKGLFGAGSGCGDEELSRGPLGLAVGDGVGYYDERFTVTGLRRIEGEKVTVHHYVLVDGGGQRAVLAAEDGPEQKLALERVVQASVDWNADILDKIADEPFRIHARGTRRCRSWNDGTTAHARSVAFRHYLDASGERIIALEDFNGVREIRVGEPVFEPELLLVRAGAVDEHVAGAVDEEDAAAEAQAQRSRGSPIAAAMALSGMRADDVPLPSSGATKPRRAGEDSVDSDPTAYDDDKWSDDAFGAEPAAAAAAPAPAKSTRVEDFVDSEDDEWAAAALILRQQTASAHRA